ncbi:phage integrase family protein [Caballeronia sp. S22]|uniref:phage integrase family protein n=1 Tax=Caballeronia sp. S22 TaxID=3137182 RepID=UPI0035313A03
MPPHANHPIGAWLLPRLARRLKGEGLATLDGLVAFCNRRGGNWRRDSAHRTMARAVVSRLRRQKGSLKLRVDADADSTEVAGRAWSRRSPMLTAPDTTFWCEPGIRRPV